MDEEEEEEEEEEEASAKDRERERGRERERWPSGYRRIWEPDCKTIRRLGIAKTLLTCICYVQDDSILTGLNRCFARARGVLVPHFTILDHKARTACSHQPE